MSSFEELRDQWIHDHVPSATLSLHYVFEAAENRIAALEAEALQQTECAHKALKQCDRAEKKLDSMKIMERHADWKLRAEQAEAEEEK